MKLKVGTIVPATTVAGLFFLFSLSLQTHGISGGDSGDLVTAATTFGVAHPPGYPLYTWIGFLLNNLSLGSPAFSVALLSSIPHTLVLFLLILGVKKLTNQIYIALYAGITLGSTYLFLFYSVTPEVFALLDLFIALLLIIFYKLVTTHKRIYLYLGALIFGLSLSHHHLIVILLPPLLLFFIAQKQELKKIWKLINIKVLIILVILLLCGLLPYLYALVAGANVSMINWNKPDNLQNLIRLITRADYGTFQSGGTYGELPVHRILNVKLFFQLLFIDFGILQIFLLCLGAFWLFVKRRQVGLFLLLAWVFYGPIFFFYASFPILNGFMIGTFERFLLPSYLLSSIFISCGAYVFLSIFLAWTKKKFHSKLLLQLSVVLITIILLIIPMGRFRTSYLRMQGMSFDYTANNLGRDILAPLKANSILLLVNDSPLFITQYMRYALKMRLDTMVFHTPSLTRPDYLEVARRAFPALSLPDKNSSDHILDFINLNRSTHPIYSNAKISLPENNYWIPRGLVYELVTLDNLPAIEEFATESAKIFSSYQNPKLGVLKNYSHLMLEDILDVYGYAYINTGEVLLQGGLLQDAWDYFEKAVKLEGDKSRLDALIKRGIAEFYLGKCTDALDSFKQARELTRGGDDAKIISLEATTYKECLKDEAQAKLYLEKYESLHKQKESTLDQWR